MLTGDSPFVCQFVFEVDNITPMRCRQWQANVFVQDSMSPSNSAYRQLYVWPMRLCDLHLWPTTCNHSNRFMYGTTVKSGQYPDHVMWHKAANTWSGDTKLPKPDHVTQSCPIPHHVTQSWRHTKSCDTNLSSATNMPIWSKTPLWGIHKASAVWLALSLTI